MTTWLKWECEKGNRWLTPDGNLHYDEVDGGGCTHCSEDHQIKSIGKTSDRTEASDWLLNVYKKRR